MYCGSKTEFKCLELNENVRTIKGCAMTDHKSHHLSVYCKHEHENIFYNWDLRINSKYYCAYWNVLKF